MYVITYKAESNTTGKRTIEQCYQHGENGEHTKAEGNSQAKICRIVHLFIFQTVLTSSDCPLQLTI